MPRKAFAHLDRPVPMTIFGVCRAGTGFRTFVIVFNFGYNTAHINYTVEDDGNHSRSRNAPGCAVPGLRSLPALLRHKESALYCFYLPPAFLAVEDLLVRFPKLAVVNKRYVARLFQAAGPNERPGKIYVTRIRGRVRAPAYTTKHEYKVGRTEREVPQRIHEQELANREDYAIERVINSKMNRTFERLVHMLLREQSSPRNVEDGGSEWFVASLKEIDAAILSVKQHMQFVWGYY